MKPADEMKTFYDRFGQAVAYEDDGIHIFLFCGEAVAYISDNSIYAYSGKHLGWYEHGWVWDHSGETVFFTETVAGSPAHPAKGSRPLKTFKHAEPTKLAKQIRPPWKPLQKSTWSPLSGEQFFKQ